ncbi:hypothetical protein [Sphingomonas sp.]|uniref:hypothetical protein n=1 Tax=Sphingomonas sp. TaxID=28214 RepID=UPI0035BC32D0
MTAFRANPLLAPIGALVAGVAVAGVCALVPATMLEDWVWRSGVPALVGAAAPPLGTTARAVLALTGGALTASVVWSLLYLLFGPGGLLAPKAARAAPAVRRADAHPDAPPRWPMTAADLGTPLMEVAPSSPDPSPAVVERTLPADLDQPLSAFDPAAVPAVPMTPSAPVAPLARLALAPGERIDTYVLTPPPPVASPQPKRLAPEPAAAAPSIDALLRRLEARLGSIPAR